MTDPILSWCKFVIVTTPTRWHSLVGSVPLELLLMHPAPGEWSALDCLQHLVEVEQISYPVRLKALLEGTSFPGFNPDNQPAPAPPTIELATTFDHLRQENLRLLNQVTEADLDRQALHAEYGMVSIREFLHHWAAHDLNHLVQAERALMQPFIRGCGPWDVNYTDHIVHLTTLDQ